MDAGEAVASNRQRSEKIWPAAGGIAFAERVEDLGSQVNRPEY
jgi:hypothetical protein